MSDLDNFVSKDLKAEKSGLLAIYKPSGISSKDVSRQLTRVLGKLKMGHVGTLDPIAEGVLPILLGKATRHQDYLLSSKKTYQCEIFLGKATDSLDSEGDVVEESSYDHVTKELILETLSSFLGKHEQIPPIYSAVKYKGNPLYKYARAGKSEEVPLHELKRNIEIYHLELLSFEDGRIVFESDVSKGTYIRVLGYDLARRLGTCAHMTKLIRKKSSSIHMEQTVFLKDLIEGLQSGVSLEKYLIPMKDIPMDFPRCEIFSTSDTKRLLQGQRLTLTPSIDFKMDSVFLERILNSSGEEEEVLLENKDYSLFALAVVSRNPQGVSFKIQKGLV